MPLAGTFWKGDDAKMIIKKVGGLLAVIGLIAGLGACAKGPPDVVPENLELKLNIQTLEMSIGEKFTAFPEVIADGVVLSEVSVQWSSSDLEVATASDGIITALGEGNATITASCQYADRDAAATVKVSVQKPVAELETNTPVVLDLSKEDEGIVTFDLPVDPAGVNYVNIGNDEYRIISQGDKVLIQTTHLTPGEYIMTVEQEDKIVSFPLYIASTVIYSAKDLQNATQIAGADCGYFVLGNNIDCTELTEPICFTDKAIFETDLGNNRKGFIGGFNGMGYTISNLKVPEYGLFGCIAASGVVRNVAFTNIQAEEYAICKDNAGLISQVYVQGDFSRVLFASYGPANKLENIVAESSCSEAMICQHIASCDTDGYSVSDIYALVMVGEGAQVSGWSRIKEFSNLTADATLRVCSGVSKESIPTVTAEDNFNNYWDITSGYPIFISSIH